jgi:hypothetical protein
MRLRPRPDKAVWSPQRICASQRPERRFFIPSPTPPNLRTNFGASIRGIEGPKPVGVVNLSVALMFFERSYNRITDLMQTFIELCKGPLKTDNEDYS